MLLNATACANRSPIDVPWTGVDGDVTIVAGNEPAVTTCFQIEQVIDNTIQVDSWKAQPDGRELLLLQLQGVTATSGDQAPLSETAIATVGAWESVRVDGEPAEGEKIITLEVAPQNPYTMACTVADYQSLHIEAGAVVAAKAWDGTIGGIIALRVRGELRIDGEISATAAGSRGGELRPDSNVNNVDLLDTIEAGGKGEGLDVSSLAGSGRGNLANGGGGGNAHNAGGGGGGSGGAGGIGGEQFQGSQGIPGTPTQGMGGVAVTATGRIFYGGGGGAGHQNNGVAGAGGAGGGFIFIIADTITGSGVISADGANGEDCGLDPVNSFPDGAGGGGAGGVVWVTSESSTFTGAVTATGGAGGNVTDGFDEPKGPGGGGGGGIVVLDGVTSTPDVTGGAPGLYTGLTLSTPYGAEPGAIGVVESN